MSILVSDYDGTLSLKNGNMQLNCDMLREYIADGNYFVLSSGRSYESLMEQVGKHDIPFSYLSCCDGSFLYNDYGRLLYAYPISHKVTGVLDAFKSLHVPYRLEFAYPNDYLLEYNPNDVLGSIAFTIDSKFETPEIKNFFARIKKDYPEYQLDRYGYGEEVYYLIRPHGVSKTVPIKFLQQDLGVLRQDVYTIGDNTNDKELIRDYNGYRIGNNPDIIDVSLRKYGEVHQLIKDIRDGKAIKRW